MLFRLHTFTSLILYVILLKMRNGMRYASVAFWICCLAVLLSTTSCSKSRDERPWGEYAESSLVFQPLPITPLLGSPYSIDVIDSVLVIADKVEDRTLLLYNMKDSTYVRTLSIGNGPGEVIFPIDVSVSSQERAVNVFLRQTGEFRTYPFDNLLKDRLSEYRSVDLGMADRGIQTSEGYVALGTYEDGLLRAYDPKGALRQKEDLYAEYGIDDANERYLLFQGMLSFNRQGNCFAIAPSWASDVLFYRYADGRWREYHRFQIGDGSLEKQISGRADLRIHRTNQCESICSSQNYFYVLYDGNRMDGVQRKDYRSILCFDAFTGELKHVYRVDPTVCGICVSNQKMYALLIGEDGEYMIGVTALDDLSLN